jgi:hypothetical protein
MPAAATWNFEPDFVLTADERGLTRIQKPITKPVFGFYDGLSDVASGSVRLLVPIFTIHVVSGQGFYPRLFAFIRG